jgi:hypothetical protein
MEIFQLMAGRRPGYGHGWATRQDLAQLGFDELAQSLARLLGKGWTKSGYRAEHGLANLLC